MNQKAILRILLEASVLPDLLRHGSSLVILSRAQNPCRDNKVFLRWLLTFFLWTLLIISTAHAQQVDSILNRVYPDKLINIEADTLLANIKKADSVTRAFQSGVDSVFQDFRKQISYINSTRNKLQNKIDSLNNLQLPIQKIY
ncbi:MAG: hypothetical protein UZ12_BCD005002195 [Bacteroidetes bacterium OLB12]|nr:MAG: hypothetical protein UZ12_BCD005002195 [Bacteroidetes bacterium OLB12]